MGKNIPKKKSQRWALAPSTEHTVLSCERREEMQAQRYSDNVATPSEKE